jgi:D-alanine-D-alanine ligase
MVCNSKTKLPHSYDKQSVFDPATEFLSDNELEEIVSMLYQCKFQYKIFYDEVDFIKFILSNDTIKKERLIVYNSAQSGTGAGRKSLIPAFCNLCGISVTGSNPYVVSLCRNKYHVCKLLESMGLPVSETWLFDNEWILSKRPREGTKIIIKPNYESASIGIDSQSVVIVNNDSFDKFLLDRQKDLDRQLVIQRFISGYEAEVPLIVIGNQIFAFPPVGLCMYGNSYKMGSRIFDYEHIYNDDYMFFDYQAVMDNASELIKDAKRCAKLLGLSGLCRVDFRISDNGEYYITDVATNPHFIRHSSVNFAFHLAGMHDSDIMQIIIGCASPQDSDQN